MKKQPFNKRRFALGAAVLLTAGALCAGSVAMGVGTTETDTSGKHTLDEWAELYPLQYDSYAELKTKDWTTGYEGHYSLALKLLAPVERSGNTIVLDEDGNMAIEGLEYDSETSRWYVVGDQYDTLVARTSDLKACYSCKSSNFENILAGSDQSMATETPDAEFLDTINGQIWDCYLCHTDDPTAGADANMTLFAEIMGDAYDDLSAEDRVCGQCHTHSVYNPMVFEVESWSDYNPFKYGFDVDSVLQAEIEAGFGAYDEKTGITTYRSSHAELEVTLESNHHALGVTCIDCHMPTLVDEETGEAYTDHDASQSPLQNEASLEYCLTCHTAQGIESTDAMAQMVIDLQEETAATGEVLKEKLATLYDLILDANQNGTMDEETLDAARSMYTQAKYYMEWGLFGNGAGYVKVVHNPELIASLQVRADAVLDDAIALFA